MSYPTMVNYMLNPYLFILKIPKLLKIRNDLHPTNKIYTEKRVKFVFTNKVFCSFLPPVLSHADMQDIHLRL